MERRDTARAGPVVAMTVRTRSIDTAAVKAHALTRAGCAVFRLFWGGQPFLACVHRVGTICCHLARGRAAWNGINWRDAAEFKWNDVKEDTHREYYLGNSVMAPVGRWAKGVYA